MTDVRIDGQRLLARLELLAGIGSTPGQGTTREAWSSDDVQARDLVAGWMAEAGLEVSVDAATNLVGRLPGSTGRWLATGSHLDTVVHAGHLDGAYGVVAAVEVAAALLASGEPLADGLLIAAFANEEGARGTAGMTGSHACIGELDDAMLEEEDDDGALVSWRLRGAGGDPEAAASATWPLEDLAAFVELHIEQGPVLAHEETTIGVVTGITGRQALDLRILGAANHAGTTPMHLRKDALATAAELVLAIEGLATDGVLRVATCGHLMVTPNVRNVVPGQVSVGVDLRDNDSAVLDRVMPIVDALVADLAERRGVTIETTWGQRVPPVASAEPIMAAIAAAAADLGLASLQLPSGAGHDAQIIGRRAPVGMVFVPSIDGVSHSPRERTEPEHLVAGADVLLLTLRHLDAAP